MKSESLEKNEKFKRKYKATQEKIELAILMMKAKKTVSDAGLEEPTVTTMDEQRELIYATSIMHLTAYKNYSKSRKRMVDDYPFKTGIPSRIICQTEVEIQFEKAYADLQDINYETHLQK
jgi:hypothetical protein